MTRKSLGHNWKFYEINIAVLNELTITSHNENLVYRNQIRQTLWTDCQLKKMRPERGKSNSFIWKSHEDIVAIMLFEIVYPSPRKRANFCLYIILVYFSITEITITRGNFGY